MNKQLLLEIADRIENAPPEQFHMGAWFGELIPAEEHISYPEFEGEIEPDDFIPDQIQFVYAVNGVDDNKNCSELKLACNTSACIAGWTIANDWFKTENEEYKKEIEKMETSKMPSLARDLLELTNDEASQLFYCESGSIWARYANEYGFSFNPEYSVTWNIHPKHAVDVLRRLANGDIKFREPNEDYDEYYDDED